MSEVEEAEANYFAMCLLMPRRMVEDAVRQAGGVDLEDGTPGSTLVLLARRFGVSPTLMAARIGQLHSMGGASKR